MLRSLHPIEVVGIIAKKKKKKKVGGSKIFQEGSTPPPRWGGWINPCLIYNE